MTDDTLTQDDVLQHLIGWITSERDEAQREGSVPDYMLADPSFGPTRRADAEMTVRTCDRAIAALQRMLTQDADGITIGPDTNPAPLPIRVSGSTIGWLRPTGDRWYIDLRSYALPGMRDDRRRDLERLTFADAYDAGRWLNDHRGGA